MLSHLCLPRLTANRVAYNEMAVRFLQWRDRAGIAPDFPVTPLWAPEEPTP